MFTVLNVIVLFMHRDDENEIYEQFYLFLAGLYYCEGNKNIIF